MENEIEKEIERWVDNKLEGLPTTNRTDLIRSIMIKVGNHWYGRGQTIKFNEVEEGRKMGKQEALDLIAQGQGWEESYDFYAEKLGLPTKYNKK